MRTRPAILTTCAALFASVAIADFTVVSPDKYSWSENAGWMNWGDSPAGSQPTIDGTFLRGFVNSVGCDRNEGGHNHQPEEIPGNAAQNFSSPDIIFVSCKKIHCVNPALLAAPGFPSVAA